MSLQNKVLGILVGIFATYALVAWLVLDGVLTPAFTRVEERRAVDDLERARALIALERERVEQFVKDWAYWDDTHDFVDTRDPAYAKRIIEALAAPFVVEGRSFQIGASIGIDLAPADGTSVDTLLIGADTAMYRARQRGKNVFERYAPGSVAAIERPGFRSHR